MKQDLLNKVALVTGGAGAIGSGIAMALAAAGAKVVVNDIGVTLKGEGGDASPAQAIADRIRAAGGQAMVNTDDITSWQGAQKVVQAALDSYGRIDVVINNAGNLRDRMFFKINEEEWRTVIDVHLNGTFFISRAAAPHFKDQQSGAYVHMTSTSGLIGNLGQSNYAAAKLGIVALSKSIAIDMLKFNIRSNCIAPFAWSRMTDSLPTETDEQRARVRKLQKMEAGKIAPVVVFLASDRALEVNGQIFAVRANEIMLMSQPRPVRSVHLSDGWTADTIAEIAMPAMRSNFYPIETSPDVIGWDPI